MKTKLLVFSAAFCAFVLLGTSSAFAAGTPAGTEIANVAKMTYKDLSGAAFDTLYSDTAKVTVEQVAGVTLTPTGTLQYSSDSMYVYFPHIVTNTGNGTDTYSLTSADSAGWGASIFPDGTTLGAFDPSDTTGGTIATTGAIAADGTFRILIRVFVPNAIASGLLDTIRTTATSTTVLPDPSPSAWVRDSVRTRVTELALNKSNNSSTPMPGDTIEYTINYNNNGTGSALSSTLYDTLSSDVTYLAGSATVVSGGGSVAYLTSPNRIVWSNMGNSGSVYGGMTGQMTFKVTVNTGVSAGTIISNTAYMTFTDSISGRTKNPPAGPTTSTVDSDGGWNLQVSAVGNSFSTDNDDDSVNVSQGIFFKLKLFNTGNRLDSASFARTSSLPLTWTLFRDVDSSGTYSAGDVLFNVGTDTVIVVKGGWAYFVAADTVAQSVANRSTDSTSYTVSSLTLNATTNGYHTTLVKAPVMTLTKSVVGISGRARPGDTLVYTITYTNTGSGTANQIVITDMSPTNTNYISNSVEVKNSSTGNVFVTRMDDGSDSAAGSTVSVSGGLVTVTLGNVGPQLLNDATYTGQIKFKVKIN